MEVMEDVIIGGWKYRSPRPTRSGSDGDAGVNSNITPSSEFPRSTGYPFVRHLSSSTYQNHQTPLSQLSAPERSKDPNIWKALMQPCLQLACGPLVRYDTIENDIWYGAVLIVSKCCFSVGLRAGTNTRDSPFRDMGTSTVATDAGSTYDPCPTLEYRCDLRPPTPHQGQDTAQRAASPSSLHLGNQENYEHLGEPRVRGGSVLGVEIYVYSGRVG